MKAKILAVREPDSLDLVEQAMEEEERSAKIQSDSGSPDWFHLANFVLVLMLILFLLFVWRIR